MGKTFHPLMIQGTCSNAGKSWLVAALCRIFRQDGYSVAPFKAQNMALNSFITRDGLEMGRAQVMQAEAAGILPDVRMNPILLKPTSDVGSQVIVNGVAQGNRTAQEYTHDKQALRPIVQAAYNSLAVDYDIIVIEGAGSPAEINLKQDDIVNMGMAEMANAPVLLVGDIDRGGVFASLYGTIQLLEPAERDRVRGLIINKFRGDVAILRPGLTQLETLTGKPVLGVVPYTPLDIDEEDSLSERLTTSPRSHLPALSSVSSASSASTASSTSSPGANAAPLIRIAVVRLPRLSNFTDFFALSRIPGVSVQYVDKPQQLAQPESIDCIVIPGTKSTMADLCWLRETGLEAQIQKQHAAGTVVFGICGGYQMMGCTLADPEQIENDRIQSGGISNPSSVSGSNTLCGMGLLPVDTVFRAEKITVQATGQLAAIEGALSELSGAATVGYEIHMGETTRRTGAKPFQTLQRQEPQVRMRVETQRKTQIWDGCQAGNAYGTYLHGIFDQPAIATAFVRALAKRKGVALDRLDRFDTPYATTDDGASYKQSQYDALAQVVRDALDMARIYRILEGGT